MERKWNQFVAECRVGLDHRFIGRLSFFETLFSLPIRCEDFRPRRRYKNTAMIAKHLSRPLHVRRDGQAAQAPVTSHIGHATIKNHMTAAPQRSPIRSYLPA